MPKETFLKLPEEKKKKIIKAAKKEFKRVPLEQASIKNIVEDAEIARGSFYQYFESKEDLMGYILNNHLKKVNKEIEKQIEVNKGDIFKIYIAIYDYTEKICLKKEDMEFYRNIFDNLKTSEDNQVFDNYINRRPKTEHYYEKINKTNLRMSSKEEFEQIERILFTITTKAIIMRFKYESKEEARKEYLKQMEYLKYGILKNKE